MNITTQTKHTQQKTKHEKQKQTNIKNARNEKCEKQCRKRGDVSTIFRRKSQNRSHF